MPKFLIRATVYATYEYVNTAEIEADTAEEAGKKFEEIAAQRKNSVIDLSEPVDKAFDIKGAYSVYVSPESGDIDDVDIDYPDFPEWGDKEFSGPQ